MRSTWSGCSRRQPGAAASSTLNAQPQRLDLGDSECRLAKAMGIKLAICTDAHSTAQLDYMRFGVAQARRGWLARGDVLNSRPWGDVEKLLRRH